MESNFEGLCKLNSNQHKALDLYYTLRDELHQALFPICSDCSRRGTCWKQVVGPKDLCPAKLGDGSATCANKETEEGGRNES